MPTPVAPLRIAGRAIAFNSPARIGSGFNEIIRPGAVNLGRDVDVKLLWSHNTAEVLGRTSSGTLRVHKTQSGLEFLAVLPQAAAGRYETVARGDISNMSFGFITRSDVWSIGADGVPLREVLDLELLEVSIVAWPAYGATSVGVVRSTSRRTAAPRRRRSQRAAGIDRAARIRLLQLVA